MVASIAKVSDAYDLRKSRKLFVVSVYDTLSLMIAFAMLMITIDRKDRK
ncbi:putative holin-like toxin [Secundilactobacillus mixtipabuli]